MKKIIIILLFILAVFPTMSALGQTDSGFATHLEFRIIPFKFDNTQWDYLPGGWQIGFGYRFGSTGAVFAVLESTMPYREVGDLKDVNVDFGLGIRGDINIADFKNRTNWLGAFLNAGSSLEAKEYHYFYGEAGLKLGRRFKIVSIYISLGVRYVNPYKKENDNILSGFGGFGIQF